MILRVSDQSSCIPIGCLLNIVGRTFSRSRDPEVPRRPSQTHIDVYPLPSLDAISCHTMLHTAMLYKALVISNSNRMKNLSLILEHHNLRSQRANLISVSTSAFAFALIPPHHKTASIHASSVLAPIPRCSETQLFTLRVLCACTARAQELVRDDSF
jgi:hypothetical protein